MLTAVYNYPENGYRPADNLEAGCEYVVTGIFMGQSYTSIDLEGYSTGFNSVQFDFYEDGELLDIYRDKRYNPYLKWEG